MADPAKPIRKSDLTSAMDVAKAAMPAIDSALRSSNRTQAIAIEAAPLRANKPGVIEALRALYPDWSIKMDIRGGRAEIETLVFS